MVMVVVVIVMRCVELANACGEENDRNNEVGKMDGKTDDPTTLTVDRRAR